MHLVVHQSKLALYIMCKLYAIFDIKSGRGSAISFLKYELRLDLRRSRYDMVHLLCHSTLMLHIMCKLYAVFDIRSGRSSVIDLPKYELRFDLRRSRYDMVHQQCTITL